MLVLSRKRDEQIVINKDIVITIVELRGDKVRVGITAPKDVPVHRREIYELITTSEGKDIYEATPAARDRDVKAKQQGAVSGTATDSVSGG